MFERGPRKLLRESRLALLNRLVYFLCARGDLRWFALSSVARAVYTAQNWRAGRSRLSTASRKCCHRVDERQPCASGVVEGRMSIHLRLHRVPKNLLGQIGDTRVVRDLLNETPADDIGLDVGPGWQAVHWVLAGGDFHGLSGVCGGTVLPSTGKGMIAGPQFVAPDEVTSFARGLERVSEEHVRALYDASAMVDDGVWPNPDLDEVIRIAAQVRAFYARAHAGMGRIADHGMNAQKNCAYAPGGGAACLDARCTRRRS